MIDPPDLMMLLTLSLIACLVFSLHKCRPRRPSTTPTLEPPLVVTSEKAKQTYDAFLILDVEGTCTADSNFDYPNEIIELPVCLMRWKDRMGDKASQLEVVQEFHSYVKPTWRPTLSKFCTELTGITQDQVDAAPEFTAVLRSLRHFLVENKLIEKSGKRRIRYCWCSDGPFDIRDFVVKQCFISQIPIPEWIAGDVLDVRAAVAAHRRPPSGIRKFNIPAQLSTLGLSPFRGRLHSGIDDARNIARIVARLALDGVRLRPNTSINFRRRWSWMGRSGQIKL